MWIQSFPSPRPVPIAELKSLVYPTNYSLLEGEALASYLLQGYLSYEKMQTALSRIWTRVAVSISYDDNHYTTSASVIFLHFAGWLAWDYDFEQDLQHHMYFSLISEIFYEQFVKEVIFLIL